MKRVAVVLCNLGGPDSIEAIRPFLFNLFYDRHIIDLPNPFRYLLAWFISKKRAPVAAEIYGHLGGASPILANTQEQAELLEVLMNQGKDCLYKVFVMMSYWHPFPDQVGNEIREFDPQEIVLLPLYPMYSTTTTLSCIDALKQALNGYRHFNVICCYNEHKLFVKAHCELIEESLSQLEGCERPIRVLFSAHGLPVKVISKGDPYQYQVERSAKLIVRELGIQDLDWKVCYQSKVGRAKWLEPCTEGEIINASKEGKHVVVVPIAFVSEHSETLVELDIEYKQLAGSGYTRVPALGASELFINCLNDLVVNKSRSKNKCPGFARCWRNDSSPDCS